MNAPLDVIAALELRGPAGSATLTGHGDRLRLDLVEPRTLTAIARVARRRLSGVSLSGRSAAGLRRADLALDVALSGRIVGRMGRGARPGRLAALFGLTGLEVSFAELVRALWQRPGGRA